MYNVDVCYTADDLQLHLVHVKLATCIYDSHDVPYLVRNSN